MVIFQQNYKILRELKFRIIYCLVCFFINFICLFLFSEEVIFGLTSCFLNDLGYFINTDILENFYVSFFIAFFLSFLIVFPFILIQFWFFIVSGLFLYENKIYLFILILYCSIFLLLLKNNFLISFIWKLLKNYNIILHWKIFPIFLELSLINLINLIINFIIFILVVFIFPLILILLFSYNIINLNFFLIYRKFLYILIYFIICILGLPDLFSQIITFFFICLFFELILFLFLLVKFKNK